MKKSNIYNLFENYPDADFVINSGDLVDHGDNQKQWAWMFNTGADYIMNTYMMPASGNHEGMGTNATDNFFVLSLPVRNTMQKIFEQFFLQSYQNTWYRIYLHISNRCQ